MSIHSGLTYIKGKGIWDFSRENTALVVEAESGDGIIHDGENSFKSHVIVKKTVGKQVLGYTVDLAKRSPEAVVEWLKNAESPSNETGGLIEDK